MFILAVQIFKLNTDGECVYMYYKMFTVTCYKLAMYTFTQLDITWVLTVTLFSKDTE